MATLAVIALAGIALQPVTVLKVATIDEGTILACRRLDAASTVTLVFTHSMYGGEVRETWRADGSDLVRVGIETDIAAAAEYYAYKGNVERTDNGFRVVVPSLRTSALPVRVDQIGRHRLQFGPEEISLADQVDGSVAATMSVRQVPLVAWWLGDGCGDAGA